MNQNAVNDIISRYKEDFSKHRPHELYKWEAVNWYKAHWNIDADDFHTMIKTALSKAGNLLSRSFFYAGKMIVKYSEREPEAVRDMFKSLFNDGQSLDDRVASFIQSADQLNKKHIDLGKQHFQNPSAISVYLLFDKPGKYYIYMPEKFEVFSEKVSSNNMLKGNKIERMLNYFALCDEVLKIVITDTKLTEMNAASLSLDTGKYYQDEGCRLLTDDIIFFEYFRSKKGLDWWPSEDEYHPGIDKEQWKQLWSDESVFDSNSKMVVSCFLEFNNGASCTKVSQKFGRSSHFYNLISTKLAKRIISTADCNVLEDNNEHARFWPILYVGKRATKDEDGSYIWKLRHELREALEELGVEPPLEVINQPSKRGAVMEEKNIVLFGPPGTGKTYNTVRYAVYIIEEDKTLEDIFDEDYEAVRSRYLDYKEQGLIAFTTFHQSYGYEEFIEGIRPIMASEDSSSSSKDIEYDIRPGVFKVFCDAAGSPIGSDSDIDFGIGKSPTVWKVSLERTGDNPTRTDCMENNHIRIGWDEYGEYIDDSIDYKEHGGRAILNAFYNQMQIGDIVLTCYSSKTIDAIGVVTGEAEWSDEYNDNKRIRPVKWLVKCINEDIVELNGGKAMTLSTVYRLSVSVSDVMQILKKTNPELFSSSLNLRNRVFIIDEINRGNISKVFGELITLIEPSKRIDAKEELRAELPYSKTKFGVPDNVYIVGTMNTADRSIAMMDTALRRRFEFIEIRPDSEEIRKRDIVVDGIDVAKMLDTMNKRIQALHDREHTIGHSFFLALENDCSLERLAQIFEKKILPLLQEYFYDDYDKIRLVLGDNQKSDKALQFVVKDDVDRALFGNVNDDTLDDAFNYSINNNAFMKAEAYEYLK